MTTRRRISIKPARFQRWPQSVIRLNNLLLGKAQAFTFEAGQKKFRLSLLDGSPYPAPTSSIALSIGIGDTNAVLRLNNWPMLEELRQFVPEELLPKLPENLAIAAIENALGSLIQFAELGLSDKIQIQGLKAHKINPKETVVVNFELMETDHENEDPNSVRVVRGRLYVEERLLPHLQQRLSHWPSSELDAWLEQPLDAHIQIGHTVIPMQQINKLERDDILLMDGSQFKQQGLINLRFGHQIHIEGRLDTDENPNLTLTSGWKIMSNIDTKKSASQINQIPVQLTFDLGHKSMAFNEVKQLRPGYVVDMPESLPEVVKIHAHNRLIGTGEIVDISGRLGIRIISLFGERDKTG